MADLDSRRLSSVRDFVPTRPTLPPASQIEWDTYGYPNFAIQTAKGEIHVARGWNGWHLRGTSEALETFGAVSVEWLPGRPGNGKTRQTVAFAPDGQIFMGPWKGTRPKLPRIHIAKNSGGIFTVEMPLNSAEQAQLDELKQQREQRETWEAAKSIRQDRNFIGEWQKSILRLISDLEGLVDGRRYFTGFPEIGLRVREQKPILAALAEAKRQVEYCTPQYKDAIRMDNVYSLNGETYRRMAHQ